MEDYTNKYKGEQVEIALFGGEVPGRSADGLLLPRGRRSHRAERAHPEIPLQNVASLHCSSRCDAPEPDWPPRGLHKDDGAEASATTRSRACAAAGDSTILRNVLKAWLVVIACRAPVRFRRLEARRVPARRSSSAASIVLSAAALLLLRRRIVMGMVGARELLPGEAPALHSTLRAAREPGGGRQAAALRAR